MKERKGRQEINLSRLLGRCQEIANTSQDISQEWRLPKFVSSCEEILASLPKPPDPAAPSAESLLQYRNSLDLLKKLLPMDTDNEIQADISRPEVGSFDRSSLPLPQGSITHRDTMSRQIYQRAVEKQQTGIREQLFGHPGTEGFEISSTTNFDKLLEEHRDQQERVAEEMIALTRSLKEQSEAAGSMLRQDTSRLAQTSEQADTNLTKLGVETQRVGEFSGRGSCRCWIWLMMGLVVLTFLVMVMAMRLFRKKVPVPVYETVTMPPTIPTSKSEL